MATSDFQVTGNNPKALFTLKVHRGDGMALLGMNWKSGKPTPNFVGFAIEYKEPNGTEFFVLKNRLAFDANGSVNTAKLSTRQSPIQKFRWVHFPRNANLAGAFLYRVTPVFMNDKDELSYGEFQEAAIELARETYPGKMNVTFTRGFVASQAFVDKYEAHGPIDTLLPAKSADGLDFDPTHPLADEALAWMGFEARDAILELLDEAIKDKTADVRVVAYDLSEKEVVTRLAKLGKRLHIIVDDSKEHGDAHSGETQAAELLEKKGATVLRQHMRKLQHNKTIAVSGKVNKVVCGSTNFTWRGLYVQSNNALVVNGKAAVKIFFDAFDSYFNASGAAAFGKSASAGSWLDLGVKDVDAKVTFSPHSASNAVLADIASDLDQKTTSSLLYSLAFLNITPGAIKDAIAKHTKGTKVFVYGIADKKVGGIEIQTPDGNVAPVFPSQLTKKNTPEPFKSEPTGGNGNRMHHKFLVIDFDKPTARVYLGSYNFSSGADIDNGENLVLIKDRRIATSYAIEALRIFDHYHFRVKQLDAKKAKKKLTLQRPPKPGKPTWFDEDWTNARKIRDRVLFS